MHTFQIHFQYCESDPTLYQNWRWNFGRLQADTPAEAIADFKEYCKDLMKTGKHYRIESVHWTGFQDEKITNLINIENRKLPETIGGLTCTN